MHVYVFQVVQTPSTFIHRSYLHVRINECWLNEDAEENIQDEFKSSLSYYNIVACLYPSNMIAPTYDYCNYNFSLYFILHAYLCVFSHIDNPHNVEVVW